MDLEEDQVPEEDQDQETEEADQDPEAGEIEVEAEAEVETITHGVINFATSIQIKCHIQNNSGTLSRTKQRV